MCELTKRFVLNTQRECSTHHCDCWGDDAKLPR